MNKENILAVADAIETHSVPDLGFNMGGYFFEGEDADDGKCGTVACIAGWTCKVLGEPSNEYEHGWTAGDHLGLDHEQRTLLFTPRGWLGSPEIFKARHAVRVLRHLAETGEVDWAKAMAE